MRSDGSFSPEGFAGKFLTGVSVWLICQLFVSIWWASNVTTRLDQIETNMVRSTEISDRLIKVETQLQNLSDILCSLQTELRESRKYHTGG